jgi:hypothetical protein
MPEKPNQTQMLGAIIATARIMEAEAILRFNASPTLEMSDRILKALTEASKGMRPAEFQPFPCWGVHIGSMCWPKPLVDGWLQPFLQDIQAGYVVGPDGKPFPLLK